MVKICLTGLIVVVVIVRFFRLVDISLSDFLIILALCWGFIGTIEAIEKLGKQK